MRLYRGVSKRFDEACNGKLLPKGDLIEVCPLLDGKWTCDGTFQLGYSADNAARAHQIESGLYNGCFVSTTRSEQVAIKFATANFTEAGWVYVIDEARLEAHDVIAREFSNPKHADQFEVSLASSSNGALPAGIIIEKYEVDARGTRTLLER